MSGAETRDAAPEGFDPVADALETYRRDAATYVERYLALRAHSLVDLVAEHLHSHSGTARVLDAGCGPGRDLDQCRTRGWQPIGVDATAAFVRRARGDGHTAIHADLRSLPLRDDSFDASYASASLVHLPDADAATAVRELLRVTRPGGPVVITIKTGPIVDTSGRWFRSWTPASWDALLHTCGADIIHRSTNRSPDGQAWLVRTITHRP